MQRTNLQNKAIHKFCTELANELTNRGLDMRAVLKPDVDIPWNERAVKEHIWRPIQRALLDKESTTELTTAEVDQVFQIIQKHLGEKFGLELQFPNWQSKMLQLERDTDNAHGEP